MKSNVIEISKGIDNLNKIFLETQKIATYAELDLKKTLRAQLIAEELVGMLKELSANFAGEFFIEQNDSSFAFVTRIYVNESMDKQKKRKFIDVSTDKKNSAAKGIMGKIRDIVENMLYPEDAEYNANLMAYQIEDAEYNANNMVYQLEERVFLGETWSLNKYKESQKNNEEPWDELEKSIIANLADDVAVSVKGKNVEIVITKNFKKEI